MPPHRRGVDAVAGVGDKAFVTSIDPDDKTSPRWRTLLWVNSTYFTEGLPYMIVRKLSTVFFTDIGVDLKSIGYLNFLGAPWNFKFLWAPLLDIFGTKRTWLVSVQVL